MSRFEETAAKIFEAAECASSAGHELSDLTILIAPEGGISLVADSGWSLESLQMDRGASLAYRVSQHASIIKVEGRAGSRTCLFETRKPNGVARFLLDRPRQYSLSTEPAAEYPSEGRAWLALLLAGPEQ